MADEQKERRTVKGRRREDKNLQELRTDFQQHLIDCTNARKENTIALGEIKEHLNRQDEDLSEIRALKRIITIVFGSFGSIAALLEIIRYFSHH